MAEVTIRHQFYNWMDEDGFAQSARKGETVELSDEEVERGDSLGAFESSPDVTYDLIAANYGPPIESDPESGVAHGQPPEVSDDAKEFPEDEEVDDDEEPDLPEPVGEAYPEQAEEEPKAKKPAAKKEAAKKEAAKPAPSQGQSVH